jgi:hypothetical protein
MSEREFQPLSYRIPQSVTESIPVLARGRVWCRRCGYTQRVDSAECLRKGWPKHCGYTMTIDSPDEASGSTK